MSGKKNEKTAKNYEEKEKYFEGVYNKKYADLKIDC